MTKCVFILCVVTVILFTLTACGQNQDTATQPTTTVRFYYHSIEIDPNLYALPEAFLYNAEEIIAVEGFTADFRKLMYEHTGLQLSDLWFEDYKLYVDLHESAISFFDHHSTTGGTINATIFEKSLLSIPGISSFEVLVNGQRGAHGNHFNFGHITIVENGEVVRREFFDLPNTDNELPPQSAMAQSSPIPLTEEKIEGLISFFAQFGGWFGVFPALADYDINLPESTYAALEFVLSSRVFTHGREGILGYPHYGFVAYMGGQRFRSWDEMPDGIWAAYEFITSNYVDSVLWSLFGISDFEHGASSATPTFGFWYHYGGYYYRALAQGCGDRAAIQITAIYDNGNGTYSVVIEYVSAEWECCCNDWEAPDPIHLQYNIAVIQPFANNTYQLLYWRNDAPRNTPIPVRQPTS